MIICPLMKDELATAPKGSSGLCCVGDRYMACSRQTHLTLIQKGLLNSYIDVCNYGWFSGFHLH